MEAYFARQPIMDVNLRLFGYELLFRPNMQSPDSGTMVHLDGDRATTTVLDAASWAGIEKVTGGKRAFVNFTHHLLLEGVATLYPKQYLVVEILENIRIDHQVLDAILSLKRQGYLIALDDYRYKKEDAALLKIADIVKVEVDGSDAAYQNLRQVLRAVNLNRCNVLAEKVETQEVFERTKMMGCTLFQGFFFARPKTISEKIVSPLKMNQMRLMREISRPDMDFDILANIIKNDVGLTYKTLRLVNSAYYGLRNEVKSINQAVVILGRDEMRKWLTVSALCELCDDKPSELAIMSLTRAHFCELVALETRRYRNAEAYFLAGLFSLLDALTDTTLESCLESMTVPAATKLALLGGNNDGRDLLDLIVALEQGDWDIVVRLSKKLRIKEDLVAKIYLQAIDWAHSFIG